MKYTNFIPQNTAPCNITKIGVYNDTNDRIATIPTRGLTMPDVGEKLYSFGCISDVHLQYDTAKEDFIRALQFLNNDEGEDVKFTCICGDLTVNGTSAELSEYQEHINTYSPDTPVYGIAGNHESYSTTITSDLLISTIGLPLYYTVSSKPQSESIADGMNIHNENIAEDDIFIMVGTTKKNSSSTESMFKDGELQWLYETLEENRNKRCFLFEHCRPVKIDESTNIDQCSGNVNGIYQGNIWGTKETDIFESLLKHYHNIIFFHGHSHIKYNFQTKDNIANYDNYFGCHSIHISSMAVPRIGASTVIWAESEGYVADVYKNHLVLKGRDFATEEFLPIATYCLDTTIQDIEANTYIDSTGTITY
jgi:predicted phosphodiesterase